jgi:hypothetical protein
MRSNIDSLSKITNLNHDCSETLSGVINLVEEGIHRMLPEKDSQSIAEIHWIIPSVTINRGQNSLEAFQTICEVCELGFDIEFDLEFHIEFGTFNDQVSI